MGSGHHSSKHISLQYYAYSYQYRCKGGASSLFLYARVLGIYHANVIYKGPQTTDLSGWSFCGSGGILGFSHITTFNLIVLPSLPWQTRIPLDLLTQPLYYEDVISFWRSPAGKFILMGVVYQGVPKMQMIGPTTMQIGE